MTTPLVAGNARVKEARKLSRRPVRAERRLFLADGPKAVEGALSIDGCVQEIFATPAAVERHLVLADRPVTLVEDAAMATLSDSVTPAGVVAVCRFVDVPLDDVVRHRGTLVVCADVRDPGNAGTIIRTSDAAGAAGVVLAGHSVDPYNDKTVRASVGSLFHVPFALGGDPAAVVRSLQAAGFVVLAADGAGERDLYDDA
ncbi:MAG: RNA methyltransferase, partial [Myxococcales bacterium]